MPFHCLFTGLLCRVQINSITFLWTILSFDHILQSHQLAHVYYCNLIFLPSSAASMSTDLYGMAVLDACEQILSRLQPLREQLRLQLNLGRCFSSSSVSLSFLIFRTYALLTDATTEVQWESLISTAFFNRLNLSAQGFYIVPTERCGFGRCSITFYTSNTVFKII